MTPETEIDALAQELGTIFLTTPPKVPYEWESARQATKDAIYAVARHVLSQRIRAQREAFRHGGMSNCQCKSVGDAAKCNANLHAEAHRRYPDLPSDAPRVPESHEHKCGGCYGAPACVCKCGAVQRGDGTWTKTQPTAVPEAIQPLPTDRFSWHSVVERVNEIAERVNRLAASSPTEEK